MRVTTGQDFNTGENHVMVIGQCVANCPEMLLEILKTHLELAQLLWPELKKYAIVSQTPIVDAAYEKEREKPRAAPDPLPQMQRPDLNVSPMWSL